MRRRQVYAMQALEAAKQLQATTEAVIQKLEQEIPKGSCPKCKKHIGKGLHFHVKACNV